MKYKPVARQLQIQQNLKHLLPTVTCSELNHLTVLIKNGEASDEDFAINEIEEARVRKNCTLELLKQMKLISQQTTDDTHD